MIRTEHNSADFVFPFIEYSPDNKRENMPVIIQLHGAGERVRVATSFRSLTYTAFLIS